LEKESQVILCGEGDMGLVDEWEEQFQNPERYFRQRIQTPKRLKEELEVCDLPAFDVVCVL